MNGGLSSALFLVLWATVLIRLPTLGRGPEQRALWATVLALALVKTASSPAGSAALDRVTTHAAVVPHLFGVLSAYFLLRFVMLVTGWADTHPRAAGRQLIVTVAVLVALIALIGTDTAYWIVLNSYLGGVLSVAGLIFWRPAGAASSRSLRLGLRAMAAGVWIIALYAVVKTVVVIAGALGAPVSFAPIEPVANGVRTAGMILAVVGAAVPASGRARTILRAYRSLWALRPLWTLMRRTFPDVILFPRRRALIELAGFEEVRLRLYRRVIEIRDGMLALRGWLPASAHEEARQFVGDAPASLVEACAVALALDRRARDLAPGSPDFSRLSPGGSGPSPAGSGFSQAGSGLSPGGPGDSGPSSGGSGGSGLSPGGSGGRWLEAGDDLASEIAWLSAVSAAIRRPEPARFVAAARR
ncbi:MAB_1171c family putative transporter [Symbioplanes lichenis]|uniref:MAB_1171c family putative transporter n=1 Tax=Symbioplanes lichenis TaxID=1629072 RepID=UPI00273A3EC6|nr:MAB_1171c family putative transporter [Actinoplanes lichenis]